MAQIGRGFLEVKMESNHPNIPGVQELLESLVQEGSEEFAASQPQVLKYDFYSSGYSVQLSSQGKTIQVKVPSEWIDQAHDTFKRKRLRRALEAAFEKISPPES
ncbi:MAG: hypothetical protein KCHDKBKB_02110 [Elusimicrobia bacterium]|nr:hypothetical protein [Elusimicrobiota bacterium]